MSQETYEWLATNVLAGFARDRRPWWATGNEPNLYEGPVPMARVQELLTGWEVVTEPVFDGDMNPLRTHKLVRASDTNEIISVVGIDHAIHKYSDWLTGTVVETVGDDVQVSSAGLLRN